MSRPRERILTRDVEGGEIVLCQRTSAEGDLHYEVILNGAFLFSTYSRDSESALARLAIEGCPDSHGPFSVLIGGLGAGYTLRAALQYGSVGRVIVVEREETVFQLARSYFSPYNGNALADERVTVIIQDLVAFTRDTPGSTFDAACIDVDNGPHWTVWEGNRALYARSGLERMRNLLLPGGCLTIWSSRTASELEEALSSLFGSVSVHLIESVEMGSVKEHVIYRAFA